MPVKMAGAIAVAGMLQPGIRRFLPNPAFLGGINDGTGIIQQIDVFFSLVIKHVHDITKAVKLEVDGYYADPLFKRRAIDRTMNGKNRVGRAVGEFLHAVIMRLVGRLQIGIIFVHGLKEVAVKTGVARRPLQIAVDQQPGLIGQVGVEIYLLNILGRLFNGMKTGVNINLDQKIAIAPNQDIIEAIWHLNIVIYVQGNAVHPAEQIAQARSPLSYRA
ncbi:hypothetical protein D3C73_995030 [compost metagenome]